MIKNLLFDLGGVIMDIRRENCEEAFRSLGMADIGEFLGDYGQKGPFADLEAGKVSESEFRKAVRLHIPCQVTDEDIDRALNEFLIGIPRKRLEKLRELRRKYRIYMLSNTNSIMWDRDTTKAFQQEGLSVNDYFDGIVTSYEAGCCKPDPRIFLTVTERFGIAPEETLFLDDSQSNVEAASKLGFGTLHVPPGSEYYELIEQSPSI